MQAFCLKIPKALAEQVIQTASELGIFNKQLKIQHKGDAVLIPLTRKPLESELKSAFVEAQLLKAEFDLIKRHPKSLIEALEGKLPPHALSMLPKSFDIVGDIAIVEVPPELGQYSTKIGEAILTIHKNVRTILAKSGAISGPYRIREFNVIAGESKTKTVHHEHGLAYQLDVSKVYFSPRLAFEHERVANQVRNGETVIDMFAGVGPFSILIAKKHQVKVYAVDLNPDAIRYLKENARLNGVQDKVIILEGDVRALVEKKFTAFFDRAIMDLPAESIKYVDVACKAVKKGGIVHYYEVASEVNPIEKAKERFSKAIAENGRKVGEILTAKIVKATAPHEWQVVIDAQIL